MRIRTIRLTDHFDEFVEEQIEAGSFRDASEVMRVGLRLLELETQEQQEKLALLRSLADEGFQQIDQGRGIEISDEQQLSGLISCIGRRAGWLRN